MRDSGSRGSTLVCFGLFFVAMEVAVILSYLAMQRKAVAKDDADKMDPNEEVLRELQASLSQYAADIPADATNFVTAAAPPTNGLPLKSCAHPVLTVSTPSASIVHVGADGVAPRVPEFFFL